EPDHQLEVALEALRRVLFHRVERRQEDAVAERKLGHGVPLNVSPHCAWPTAAPQGGGSHAGRASGLVADIDNVPDRSWTTESFLAWEDRQEFKYEFDGRRVIPVPGGSIAHQFIVLNLCLALRRLIGDRPLMALQTMPLRIGPQIRYPDVV